MNNDTNILTMPDVSAQMTIDVDSQALIEGISTAITNGFSNLNTLQVDAVTQIETNKNNIETNTENIATNTQNIANINNTLGDITYKKISNIYYGTPKILTVTKHFRGKIILLDSSITGCGEYIIFATGSGYTDVKTIVSQTRTNITTSTSTFTFDNTASGQVLLVVESFQGTFTIS